MYAAQGDIFQSNLGEALRLDLSALAGMSMAVNALATGLIVFRIFKVFREVKLASDDQTFVVTRGNKLRSIIFILIESGMALFSIQLARVVVTFMYSGVAAYDAFLFIVAIHQQLNVIIRVVFLILISLIILPG